MNRWVTAPVVTALVLVLVMATAYASTSAASSESTVNPAAHPGFSNPSFTVSVVNSQGKPVTGAYVTLWSYSGGTPIQLETEFSDSRGQATFHYPTYGSFPFTNRQVANFSLKAVTQDGLGITNWTVPYFDPKDAPVTAVPSAAEHIQIRLNGDGEVPLLLTGNTASPDGIVQCGTSMTGSDDLGQHLTKIAELHQVGNLTTKFKYESLTSTNVDVGFKQTFPTVGAWAISGTENKSSTSLEYQRLPGQGSAGLLTYFSYVEEHWQTTQQDPDIANQCDLVQKWDEVHAVALVGGKAYDGNYLWLDYDQSHPGHFGSIPPDGATESKSFTNGKYFRTAVTFSTLGLTLGTSIASNNTITYSWTLPATDTCHTYFWYDEDNTYQMFYFTYDPSATGCGAE